MEKINGSMPGKMELIESRQAASFDKFFRTMQRLRDTIDGSATGKQTA